MIFVALITSNFACLRKLFFRLGFSNSKNRCWFWSWTFSGSNIQRWKLVIFILNVVAEDQDGGWLQRKLSRLSKYDHGHDQRVIMAMITQLSWSTYSDHGWRVWSLVLSWKSPTMPRPLTENSKSAACGISSNCSENRTSSVIRSTSKTGPGASFEPKQPIC